MTTSGAEIGSCSRMPSSPQGSAIRNDSGPQAKRASIRRRPSAGRSRAQPVP